jgi:hypothetical protein
VTTRELVDAAIVAARVGGCTCDVEVDVTTDADGLHHATVRHDHWCPLLNRRTARWN